MSSLLTLPSTPFSTPGIYNFLGRNFKAADVVGDKDVTLLSSYLVELSLVDYTSLKVRCQWLVEWWLRV